MKEVSLQLRETSQTIRGGVLRMREGRLVGIGVHLAHTSADGVLWQPPKQLKLDGNRALGFRLSGESGKKNSKLFHLSSGQIIETYQC